MKYRWIFLIACVSLVSCKSGIQERNEKLYSRHLQRNVELQILNTPPPDNKADFNLLLLNDFSAFQSVDCRQVLQQLHAEKAIQPVLLVGIAGKNHSGLVGDGKLVPKDREAEKYADFIVNELLPWIKKQSGIRKFKSVAIAGFGRSAVPAIDIGWSHADKINIAGALEPIYHGDTAAIWQKIKSSRKRPKTTFYFAAKPTRDRMITNNTEMLADLIRQKVNTEVEVAPSTVSGKGAFIGFLEWAYRR